MAKIREITIPQANIKKVFGDLSVAFAYVFGSRATRTATDESDVDVAVFFENTVSREKRFDLRLKLMEGLSRVFKKKVDVVLLNDISSLFLSTLL